MLSVGSSTRHQRSFNQTELIKNSFSISSCHSPIIFLKNCISKWFIPSFPPTAHLSNFQKLNKNLVHSRKHSLKNLDKGTDEYRRRRERNNIAVRKSREKAKKRANDVEKKLKDLQKENDSLRRCDEEKTNVILLYNQVFMRLSNHNNPEIKQIVSLELNSMNMQCDQNNMSNMQNSLLHNGYKDNWGIWWLDVSSGCCRVRYRYGMVVGSFPKKSFSWAFLVITFLFPENYYLQSTTLIFHFLFVPKSYIPLSIRSQVLNIIHFNSFQSPGNPYIPFSIRSHPDQSRCYQSPPFSSTQT